jgi:hypothetical protein
VGAFIAPVALETAGKQAVNGRVPRSPRERLIRAAGGVWVGPLVWLLALLRITLLGSEPGRTLGGLLVLAAALLAPLAWSKVQLLPPLGPEGKLEHQRAATRGQGAPILGRRGAHQAA